MNNWNCLRLGRFSGNTHRKDRKTSSTTATPRATVPAPLTVQGARPSTHGPRPASRRQSGDSASDTYIPLDECYSGSSPRPVTHYPQSANASPQVRTRSVRTVQLPKALTLGSDVYLLDIVPPSPCHPPDAIQFRSRSADHQHHDSVSYRDTVVRSPGVVRDRAVDCPPLGDQAAPTLPARRPMTPQSPPPPPPPQTTFNSVPRDVHYNGVTNEAFISAEVESAVTVSSRHVCRPQNGRHVPLSPSVYSASGNVFGQSPTVPARRRDSDFDGGRRSASGTTRCIEDEYVQSHPVPPHHPVSPVSAAGVDDHRLAGLHGPLSLSTGVLNFSPPAPHHTTNKVKLHRYMNAGTVSVVQASSGHYNGAAAASVRRTSGITTTSSTLPIARCRVVAPPRPAEPYYNDFASPGQLQYCNASEYNNHQFSLDVTHGVESRTASFSDRIPLPIKKYDNNEDHDSSTDDDSEAWRSSQSAYSSATSLDQFVAPMTSTMTQSSDVINYLTLDLDQLVDLPPSTDHHREDVDGVQRLGGASTTVYDDIDWFRTHALNDMRRQVETDRKNSTGSGCTATLSK